LDYRLIALHWGRILTGRISAFRAQAVWVVIGDAITVLALLAASMVLARTLSQEDMATFRQVIYLGPLVVGISEFGLSATVYRFYALYDRTDRQLFLWKVLLGMTGFAIAGSLGLFLGAPYISRAFANPSLSTALKICSGYPLAIMPFMLIRPVLIAKGCSLRATLWEALFSAGSAATLALASWKGAPLNFALALWMCVQGSRTVVTAWYLFQELRDSRPKWSERIVREVWSFTWPLQISRIPGLVMIYFDKVVTSFMLTKQSFAAYSLGARELPLVGGVAYSVSAVLTPHMVTAYKEGRTDGMCRYWREAAIGTAIWTYPIAAFFVWYSNEIVKVLFTDAYIEAAIPLAAFSGITFLRVVEYGSLAKAIGDSKIILQASIVAGFLSLISSVVLTYLWGIRGISLSFLISNIVIIGFYMIRYSAVLNIGVNRLLPLTKLFGLMIWSFVSVSVVDCIFSARVVSAIGNDGLAKQAFSLGVLFFGSCLLFYLPLAIYCRKMIFNQLKRRRISGH
jgi:O-antigen/teichoic acid export membrane protein